jgi:hypothetical protein
MLEVHVGYRAQAFGSVKCITPKARNLDSEGTNDATARMCNVPQNTIHISFKLVVSGL